jgi:hypothetical protein
LDVSSGMMPLGRIRRVLIKPREARGASETTS